MLEAYNVSQICHFDHANSLCFFLERIQSDMGSRGLGKYRFRHPRNLSCQKRRLEEVAEGVRAGEVEGGKLLRLSIPLKKSLQLFSTHSAPSMRCILEKETQLRLQSFKATLPGSRAARPRPMKQTLHRLKSITVIIILKHTGGLINIQLKSALH